MSHISRLLLLQVATTALVGSSALPPRPFDQLSQKTEVTVASTLKIDLGYEVYEGMSNQSSGLNTWKGIRFGAAPIGALRWQATQPPQFNRSDVIQADDFAPQCPQSSFSHDPSNSLVIEESEDCLFLNVYAPQGAKNLPVLVWIHGGGYGLGNGREDLTRIITANNNSFVGVAIQYRLGAFGFLSSDEVYRHGVVNAGMIDQHFALKWVQAYISLFGGNASAVTISGESAGGGSVMLQTMAYGGSVGDSLFTNAIAASPYLPMQYDYKDWVPSQSYYAFAARAGCLSNSAYGGSQTTIFECLTKRNTTVLQTASFNVSASGTYGTWGFLPVTDGIFVQDVPSQQLLKKRVNGRNLLVGNNANEGPLFVPQDITTESDLLAWLRLTFPIFTNDDIAKILLYYTSTNNSDSSTTVDYATIGYTGASALNESSVASGQQQRADNIYAEVTFICPSYWMAEAFSDKGRTSYKYQYSVPAAQHGADVVGYFGPATANQGSAFESAFMNIWGNFITTSNPSISATLANGVGSKSASTPNPTTEWPPFTIYAPYQINLNETGGVDFSTEIVSGVNATEYEGAGLKNDFTLVNAYTWEAGRGYRCDFWRSFAAIVPE